MSRVDRHADKRLAAARKHEASSPRDRAPSTGDKENVSEVVTTSHDETANSTDKLSIVSVEAKNKKMTPVSFSSLSLRRHDVTHLNKHGALLQLNKQERRKVGLHGRILYIVLRTSVYSNQNYREDK